MDTHSDLKQEIASALESLHDFAKWKLLVTSALAAAALGLTSGTGASPRYWLLLFVPYACAYVDLNAYQYIIRILVIARFLREHPGGDQALQEYERYCEELRGKYRIFAFGEYAQFGSSVAFSLLAPILAVIHFAEVRDTPGLALAIATWVFSLVLVLSIFMLYKRKCAAVTTSEIAVGWRGASGTLPG
jgi:hypothetical protein